MIVKFQPIAPTVEVETDEFQWGIGEPHHPENTYEVHPYPEPLIFTKRLEVAPTRGDEIWTPQALTIQFLFANHINVQLDIHTAYKSLTEQLALLKKQKEDTEVQIKTIEETIAKEPAGTVHRKELEFEGAAAFAGLEGIKAGEKAVEVQREELGQREVLEIFRQARFLIFTGEVIHIPSGEPVWVGTIDPNQYTQGQIFNTQLGTEANRIRVLATNIVYDFNTHIPLTNPPRIAVGEQLEIKLRIYGAGENNISKAETAIGTDLHLDVKSSNFSVSVTTDKDENA